MPSNIPTTTPTTTPATTPKAAPVATSRVQLALNVADLDAATRFYRNLFGVEPAKQRPGYANFEVVDPPLKLVLFENPGATAALNHLGVEVPTPEDVVAAAGRFARNGLPHSIAQADRCCHAVQDKVWVDAPDVPLGGWEFYTVLADDPGQSGAGKARASACCTSTAVTPADTDIFGDTAAAAAAPCCVTAQEG